MPVSNKIVERLAREWVKEATRLRALAVCACGCETRIAPRGFKPGHDAKLQSRYAAKIREVLASA